MKKYLKKSFAFVIFIFTFSVIIFYIAHLTPGDPLNAYYGTSIERISTVQKEHTKQALGLNKPIVVQYMVWIKNIFQGNFGFSLKYKQLVAKLIGSRAVNTVFLGGVSYAIIFILSLILAFVCAKFQHTLLVSFTRALNLIFSVIPEFWLSLAFIFLFSIVLHWFPSSGAFSVNQAKNFATRLHHLALPLSVAVLSHLWYYTSMLLNNLILEIQKQYIQFEISRGFSKNRVLWHALKNVMPSYLAIMAVALPHVLSSLYVIEVVFSYPGLGSLAFESVKYKDYHLLMMISLLSVGAVCFLNFLANIYMKKHYHNIEKYEF